MSTIKEQQKGVILIFALILIAAIITINFSIAAIFIPKLKVIRESSNSVAAFYAADSAIEWCVNEIRIAGNAAVPTISIGATYTINQISPPFASDICPFGAALNHRSIGYFRGVTRSIEVRDTAP